MQLRMCQWSSHIVTLYICDVKSNNQNRNHKRSPDQIFVFSLLKENFQRRIKTFCFQKKVVNS